MRARYLARRDGCYVDHVNVDKIVSFTRAPNINYTVMELEGGKTITVAQTPAMITGLIPR
jgi:hypothetical protein